MGGLGPPVHFLVNHTLQGPSITSPATPASFQPLLGDVPRTTGPLHRLYLYLSSLYFPLYPVNFLRSLLTHFFHREALNDLLPRSDASIKCSPSPMDHSVKLLPSICKFPFSR